MTSTSESSDDIVHPQAPTGGKPLLARQRAKQDAETQGLPPPPKTQYFPLGYKEGFSQWWASLTPAVTEHRVMSFIPYLQQPPTHLQTGSAPPSTNPSTMEVDRDPNKKAEPVRTNSIQDPYGPRQWHSQMVPLTGKNRSLNEFSVERVGEEIENNLVMLHGYGAGLGFFYKNFEGLSRLPHWKLYALDLLGMGRSSRPPFRIRGKDREAKVQEAESWFVDALEEWRIKRGIDKMTLLAHSLGGYLAVCYALKYPGHLDKLILASPVGIPEDPYAVSADLPEPNDSSIANEFAEAEATSRPPPRKPLPKWLTTLWDANVSPFSLVRMSGPLGPRLVSGWTSRRFSHLPGPEAQALHDYSYSLFRQRGSGEYALAYILAPGAFARSPLIRRIQGVGRQFLNPLPATPATATREGNVERVRETGLPVVLMYGEHDWMDIAGGYAAEEKLKGEKRRALKEGGEQARERENGDAKVTVIQKAGHHLYLEGWEQFNAEILGEMKDVERRQKKLAALDAAA